MRGTPSLGVLLQAQIREPASLVSFARTLCGLIAVMSLGVALVRMLPQRDVFEQDPVSDALINLILPASCVVLALHPRLLSRVAPGLIAVVLPLVIIWVAAWSFLSSHNNSAGGQLFFGLPVLFAAYQLRRPLALFTTVNACAAIAVTASRGNDLNVASHITLFATLCLIGITLTFAWMRDSHVHLVERLRDEAEHDHLTGLVTRGHFERSVAQQVTRWSGDEMPNGCALLLLDLDHLKQINDEHGHVLGDRALVRVAELISSRLTARDIAGRWGGDEFTVLCPDTDLETATELADDLVQLIGGAQVPHPGGAVALSVTVGLGHLPTQAHDADTLYRAADRGLYVAKQSGRGRVGHADD